MKLWLAITAFILVPILIQAQTRIPDVETRSISGETYDLGSLAQINKPVVIMFWATWCKPCIEELDNISEMFIEWQDEIEFELVAVCVDDTRSSSVLRSFVAGKDWPFIILLDTNQDIMRAMNVTEIPHYYLYDEANNLVHKHTGYTPGNEFQLYNELKKLVNE